MTAKPEIQKIIAGSEAMATRLREAADQTAGQMRRSQYLQVDLLLDVQRRLADLEARFELHKLTNSF